MTYCKSLESGGRYLPIVWPEHCIIGTPGHNVVPSVRAGLQHWVSSQHAAALLSPVSKLRRSVDYVFKGTNPLTEMYSCMSAECPVPDDSSTHYNTALFDSLAGELDADDATSRLLVCGQASSHCVASSVRDIVAKWEEGAGRGVPLDRIVLLKDCMSPVPGFESVAEQFFDAMKSKGVSVRNSTELL
jgi:nicotinamidase-related amidase